MLTPISPSFSSFSFFSDSLLLLPSSFPQLTAAIPRPHSLRMASNGLITLRRRISPRSRRKRRRRRRRQQRQGRGLALHVASMALSHPASPTVKWRGTAPDYRRKSLTGWISTTPPFSDRRRQNATDGGAGINARSRTGMKWKKETKKKKKKNNNDNNTDLMKMKTGTTGLKNPEEQRKDARR